MTLPRKLDVDALPGALRAPLWFIERAIDGGIPLTTAGDLRPVDVEAAYEILRLPSYAMLTNVGERPAGLRTISRIRAAAATLARAALRTEQPQAGQTTTTFPVVIRRFPGRDPPADQRHAVRRQAHGEGPRLRDEGQGRGKPYQAACSTPKKIRIRG